MRTELAPHSPGLAFLVAALAICLSVLLFAPLAWLVYQHLPVPSLDPQTAATYALDPADFRPEPAERLCYFGSLLFFPLAIPALMLALSRYLKPGTLDIFDRLASVAVWLYLAALLFGSDAIHLNSCYLKYSWLGLFLPYRLAVLALLGLAWKICKPRLSARVSNLLLGAGLLALGLTSFVHPNDPYVEHTHLNAVYYSLVQVYEGRVLLQDFYNQYGLYPYFLLPLYRLTGLNLEIFSVSMGLLSLASFAGLYFVLRRVCGRSDLALVGFLACLNLNYFYLKQLMAVEAILPFLDQYFQYWPIRMLFPSLMLVLLCGYFQSGKRLYYVAGMLLLGPGCFWNLDSGVPAWGTWVLTLGYAELLRPIPLPRRGLNLLIHLAVALACLLLVTGLVEAGLFLACGNQVALSGMVHIHKVFYALGFYMLPMQLPHSWMLVALLYFGGLARSFQALRMGQDELRPKIIFALSIFGLGCFSYFQGRSHDWVLLAASWPATLLAVIFAHELRASRIQGLPRAIFWLLTTLILNYALSLPLALKDIFPSVQSRLIGRPTQPAGHMLHEEIDYLQSAHSTYPRRMLILSNHSALLHQLTASQFLVFDDFCEMFRVEDWTRLAAAIETESSPWIIVGFDFFRDDQDKPWRQLLINALHRHYRCLEASPNRRLQIFAPVHTGPGFDPARPEKS